MENTNNGLTTLSTRGLSSLVGGSLKNSLKGSLKEGIKNNGVQVALGSLLGAGLAYVAYRACAQLSHQPHHHRISSSPLSTPSSPSPNGASLLVQDVDEGGATRLGWQLKGRRVLVAGTPSSSPSRGSGDVDNKADEDNGSEIDSEDEAKEDHSQFIKSVAFLLTQGAIVTIMAPWSELSSTFQEQIKGGAVGHEDRLFVQANDLTEQWDLLLYATPCHPTVVDDLTALCRKKRIPVSFLDNPDRSDFWIDLGPIVRSDKKVKSKKEDISRPQVKEVSTLTTPQLSSSSHSQSQSQSTTHSPTPLALNNSTESNVPDIEDIPEVVIGIFDGYAVARYVGQGFADVFYDFSFAEDASSHFERVINAPVHHLPVNIYGDKVKVLLLDAREGAAGALYGTATAESGVKAHGVVAGGGLLEMGPVIQKMQRERVPCVVHAAVATIGDDLSILPNLSDIVAIQHTGVAIVNSTTPQEAHDLAVISHISSQILSSPFVHFFDLHTTARTATTVHLLSRDQVAQLTDSAVKTIVSNEGDGTVKRVANVVDAVMTHAQEALGKKYEIFEYVGSADAEILFVSVGDSSAVVRGTVGALASTVKLGAIIVHLLRPWDSQRFAASVPASVKKIVVLGTVFSEVVASFHVTSRQLPHVVKVENSSTYVITPTIIRSILEFVIATPRPSRITLPLPISDDAPTVSLSLPTQSSLLGEVWENPEENIAGNIHSLLSNTQLNVAACANVGILPPDNPDQATLARVKSTVFHLAKGDLPIVDRSNMADFLVVYDVSLLNKVNVFANLKPTGTFILQWPYKIEELEEKLPSSTKREIAGKRLKFYTFSASKDSPAERLAAFFSLSGVLSEVGGLQALISSAKTGKHTNLTALQKAVETQQSSQLHKAPSEWLDAAENHELLPPPKAKVIPQKNPCKGVKALDKTQEAIKYLLFSESYAAQQKLRPDIQGAHLVTVTVNRRLTPASYERNVFHIEFDTTGTGLQYQIGEALAVYGQNDIGEVARFLSFYKLNPKELVALPFKGSTAGQVHVRTIEQIFTQYLDLFGRPSKDFYIQLAECATDPKEKENILHLTTPEGQSEYKKRVDNTVTFEDILLEFPSAHPSVEKLLELIPPIKPRHYSIASSMKMHPNSVHLLVVLVNWETETKKSRFGHCTRYLSGLKGGELVTVAVKPSVMTLPPIDSQPIVMAGLGTGMAPFRAFIQERAVLKSQGIDVGPIVLYFGSRSRFAEYLYGEELEAYNKEGLLTHLGLAFSRDQVEKIYIQHKIEEDKSLMWQMLVAQKGHFYLCGPTWPEADVRNALLSSFQLEGNMSIKDSEDLLEKIRVDERYILELY